MQFSRTNRAKQFLPFDALKGLQEALREKEIQYEDRKELSEETLTNLDKKFNRIEIGNYIEIRYYKNRQYVIMNGTVTKIDFIKSKIQINENENINISDINTNKYNNIENIKLGTKITFIVVVSLFTNLSTDL